MTRNVTERIRRQRKMILPMSFAMLLVATIVRALILVYVNLLSVIVLLASYRRLRSRSVWIRRSKERQCHGVLRRPFRSNASSQHVLFVPSVGDG
jgi:cbb3-type cytochrome oxidase cytochrome c subunit